MIYQRESAITIRRLAKVYPVTVITGPRQSGKTTLTRSLFKNKKYVSLEDLDQKRFANEDPKAFLTQEKSGLLIDEIQNSPHLFSYMQGIVDQNKKPGQFIITGSQQFNLLSKVSQSLAGRSGLLELLPFSLNEAPLTNRSLNQVLYKGLYPPLYDRKFKPSVWYEDYVKTYIERDVRQLIHIGNLSLFQKFISLCAARSGTLINYSELGNITGIDIRTVKSWLSVLEASYIIFFLKPYHSNFSKKLVKTPKLYFYDPGLLCYLLRLREEDLLLSPYKGSVFESLIISECVKYNKNRRGGMDFYFWRDNKQTEIDLLIQNKQKVIPVEIKSGQTIQSRFFDHLKRYQKYSFKKVNQEGFLIYGGLQKQKRSQVQVLSWKAIYQIFK